MSYNPYQPYGANPYGQPNYGVYQPNYQPQMQAQPQSNTYAFVNGIEGAKSFPMQPNQIVMLMDSDNPIAYMKQSNGMGQATIKYYRLVETSEQELRGGSKPNAQPSVEYATKAEFEALARKVEDFMSSKKGE